MDDDSENGADPSEREVACFEAGIKFGSLYHQFAGTPVSPASADSLAAAMEEAIENQPHCLDVRVDVDEDALSEAVDDGAADYTELTGRFVDVNITVEYDDTRVETRMRTVNGYPRMEVVSVSSVIE